jgi:hypothetical protein
VRIRGPEFLINTLRVLFEFPIPFEGNSTFETLDASGGVLPPKRTPRTPLPNLAAHTRGSGTLHETRSLPASNPLSNTNTTLR